MAEALLWQRLRADQSSNDTLPKGAYRVPGGGYVSESRHLVGKRVIIIRAVHKDQLDIEKLARALLRLARESGKPWSE